ncbi:MAG: thiolase family protein [Zestosphaera sp.]
MKAYVVGSGVTKVDRHYDKNYLTLIDEAVSKALADSGLDASDVEYLVVSTAFSETILDQVDPSTYIAQNLGLKNVKTLTISSGEVSGAVALDYAYSLVKAGRARRILVVGFEKMSEYPSWVINKVYAKILEYEVEGIKNVTPPDYAALIMSEYMRKYRVSREDIVRWSVKMHENAVRTPHAQLQFTISVDSLGRALRISEPVTMLDSHPVSDGAAALLVADESATKKTNREPVEVVDVESSVNLPIYLRDDITYFSATASAYKKLSSKNEIKLSKTTALNVYDTYDIYGLLTIEALEICGRGEALKCLSEMPYLNVGGGLKARGNPVGATPIYQIHELRELISGASWVRYDGDISLAHSMSGPDNNAWLILLRRWV